MTKDSVALLFFGGIIACLVVHVQLWRRAYKKIAVVLNAEYQWKGFLKGGKISEISGESSGKKFTIENIPRGLYEYSIFGIGTTISVNCQNRRIPPLTIYGSFFDINNFPNWKYAFITRGDERKFLSSIEERHKPFVQGLFQEIALFNYNFIKKGRIEVKQDKIIFCKAGVIKNIEIIKQVIQLLVKIACRIESTPIA